MQPIATYTLAAEVWWNAAPRAHRRIIQSLASPASAIVEETPGATGRIARVMAALDDPQTARAVADVAGMIAANPNWIYETDAYRQEVETIKRIARNE